jgi:hypothetical protein
VVVVYMIMMTYACGRWHVKRMGGVMSSAYGFWLYFFLQGGTLWQMSSLDVSGHACLSLFRTRGRGGA